GDTPILTEVLPDDPNVLAAASKRLPRNMVARNIIQDLDSAVSMLKDNAPESGRITSYAALMLKSRVALFEATWERYHANTAFVPGNSKWPGKDWWPDFQWPAGSADAEINWFLEQAIDAADKVASTHALSPDYIGMFNSIIPFAEGHEVILARYYMDGVKAHSCSALLKSGGGCNATRALVNSYLMQSGLPIYADSEYQGDLTSYEEFLGRDLRLRQSVRAAGEFIEAIKGADGKYYPDTIYYYRPNIWVSGNEKATTGYELDKWVSKIPEQRIQYHCTTAVPIFRAAEAYLNYIEAYYERYGNLGGNCDRYWRAIRKRAGVDDDYNKTIAATDLSKENDLAVWSHGKEVSPVLYNIRRERRCEFIAEGLRLNDLKRWRSLDKMVNYQPEGINLWGGPLQKMYSEKELKSDLVSQPSSGNYIMPFRINSTSPVYEGYNFPKAHYLEPIPITEFLLTTIDGKSTLYQNPGWPDRVDGTADYTGYDYD
ncbi:MAG: RagB/SusD family nutrient uptake outer membrane protein, partial [Paramuribaculum sp.]|nr:RagB/SusD family nutrient uptake outer membrane protein [Paramuribaculum sp.]